MDPEAPVFLTASWQDLVMLSHEVDPAVLAPLVPEGTVLDAFEGRTLVSLVGFRFLDTRVRGFAIPFHRHFDEVNLRFYVRRMGPEGWRRGVVFVKEIVPRRLIALVARVVYGENYVALPMRHDVVSSPAQGHVEYSWKQGRRWNRIRADVAGSPAEAPEGSEAAFVTEHYWGYTRQRDGYTLEYRVEHPRWKVWRATDAVLDLNAAACYGSELAPFLCAAPTSAFVADGSAVVVRRGSLCEPTLRA